jgi:hypothetical protein
VKRAEDVTEEKLMDKYNKLLEVITGECTHYCPVQGTPAHQRKQQQAAYNKSRTRKYVSCSQKAAHSLVRLPKQSWPGFLAPPRSMPIEQQQRNCCSP